MKRPPHPDLSTRHTAASNDIAHAKPFGENPFGEKQPKKPEVPLVMKRRLPGC